MIAAIESAMLARLEAARADDGPLAYLRTLKGYGGEFDQDRLAEAVRQFPAVWLFYGGEDAPRELMAGRAWQGTGRWSVYAGARALRNEASSRQGAAADQVGSYQVLMDVRALLAGQTLGLNISPIEPGAVRSVAQEYGVSIYRLELSCAYPIEAAGLPAEAPVDFLRLHLDWDIPPHGTVVAPLPAAAADARDDVTLEGASA